MQLLEQLVFWSYEESVVEPYVMKLLELGANPNFMRVSLPYDDINAFVTVKYANALEIAIARKFFKVRRESNVGM